MGLIRRLVRRGNIRESAGRICKFYLNKSYEFYFCFNIIINFFWEGSVIKEVVFLNGILIV